MLPFGFSILLNSRSRVQHIEPLLQKSGKDFQIVTSIFSITEVAFAAIEQANRVLDPEIEEKIAKLWRPGSPILMAELYPLITERAQQLMRAAIIKGWSLKPADAIHLATADQLKVGDFHTYDDRLEKYSEITENNFRIGPPVSTTPYLLLHAANPTAGDTVQQEHQSAPAPLPVQSIPSEEEKPEPEPE